MSQLEASGYRRAGQQSQCAGKALSLSEYAPRYLARRGRAQSPSSTQGRANALFAGMPETDRLLGSIAVCLLHRIVAGSPRGVSQRAIVVFRRPAVAAGPVGAIHPVAAAVLAEIGSEHL